MDAALEKKMKQWQDAKKYGDKVFLSSEAPDVKVITTGIPSLDAAIGVGGFPRGTVTEIFGKASVGKSALTYYTIAAVQRAGGYAAYINLESNWKTQAQWAERIAGVDNEKLVVAQPSPGQEAINLFLEMVAETEGGKALFDVIVFDSVGAVSTDNEMKIGNSKQAFGQSAMITQLAKNAAVYANKAQNVPIILNQVRDEQAGTFTVEKAPGGRAKEHMATLRINLKRGSDKRMDKINGQDIEVMRRITAQVVKNKVSAPHQKTGWNFWNYPAADGTIGIDIVQNAIDAALQFRSIESAGTWFKHGLFPGGKLQGQGQVAEFLKSNPDALEQIRREFIMTVYNSVDEKNIRELEVNVE